MLGAVILLMVGLETPSSGLNAQDNWIDSLPKPWTLNQDQISKILPGFYQHYPDFLGRLRAFALWQVGKPYEIFSLGEEQGPDPDPLLRLDVSDCTVHVLTALAVSQSHSWEEARQNMIRIHYKPNREGVIQPSYQTRWHYTTDRLQENPYTVDITTDLFPRELLEKVTLVLNRKADSTRFLPLDWEKPVTVYYIPNHLINENLLKKVPPVCGVAFVRKTLFKSGLIIAHEGMLIDGQNLVHASAEYKRTVNVDFLNYYFRDTGPVFDGILIYAFEPLNQKDSSHSLD